MASQKIIKGDLVKIISGKNKGKTGKVEAVLVKQKAVLIEGLGHINRKVKPSAHNPKGGQKDIHIPISNHKIALVIEEKTEKISKVGFKFNNEGKKIRVARQNNNKEIK